MRAGVGVALACVVLSACGVRSQEGPERLPADLLPPELRPSAAAAPSSATTGTTATATATATAVPVYLVEDGRLVRRDQPARQRTLDEALAALLVAGDREGAARSAVPAGTVLERVDVRGQLASLRLSGSFAEVRGRDQLLAVAQLVWTATEFPPVREVDVLVDGRRLELPVEQGEVSSGPARRDDYRSVGPAG